MTSILNMTQEELMQLFAKGKAKRVCNKTGIRMNISPEFDNILNKAKTESEKYGFIAVNPEDSNKLIALYKESVDSENKQLSYNKLLEGTRNAILTYIKTLFPNEKKSRKRLTYVDNMFIISLSELA